MLSGAYHPPWSSLLHPVTCEQFCCSRPATHEGGGFRLCLDHFLHTLQDEQPRVTEVSAS